MSSLADSQIRCCYLYLVGILRFVPSTPHDLKAPFDEPIRLANGKILRTLGDAAHHIIAMPARETKERPWQVAMSCLLAAAEKRGPLMMARIAVVKALGKGKASPSELLREVRKSLAMKDQV